MAHRLVYCIPDAAMQWVCAPHPHSGEPTLTSLFSDRLFKTAEPIWNACLNHPFVQGIADGTLEQEKFKHYMKQDYVYLIEYCNHGPVFQSAARHAAH